jgi:hypothetical protein
MESHAIHKDVKALEKVMKRYTKCMNGLRELPYAERLKALGALSLEKKRLFADMVLVHKALNGQLGCSTVELGLTRLTSRHTLWATVLGWCSVGPQQ